MLLIPHQAKSEHNDCHILNLTHCIDALLARKKEPFPSNLEKQDVYDLLIKVCIKYSFRVLCVSRLPEVKCVS